MSPARTLTIAFAIVTLTGCEEDTVTDPNASNQSIINQEHRSAVTIAGETSAQAVVRHAPSERNKAIVLRVVEQLFNKGNLAAADDLFGPTWVDHNPGAPGLPPGPAGAKILVTVLRGAFPDLRLTVEDIIAEGDRVSDRFTIRGTHLGPLNGIPATGRAVVFTGTAFHKLSDGKIVESWANLDDLGLLRQLGVVP